MSGGVSVCCASFGALSFGAVSVETMNFCAVLELGY